VKRYIKWFYRVSHPMFCEPAPIAQYTTHIPPYEVVIVEQKWTRQVPDPLQNIENIRRRVDNVMSHLDVFTHPVFADIMEGIWSKYNMMQEEPIP
jgi:hypothetical protein